MTGRPDILACALAWHRDGYTSVPVKADGSKRPGLSEWKALQTQKPTVDDLRRWFSGDTDGLGVICGTASNGLEMFEAEGRAADLIPQLAQLMRDHGLADLWDRIDNGYVEITPGGGTHWYYRVDGPARGNTRLARRPATADELAENPAERIKVLFETRGEGGFTVVAPSGGRSHPSGKPWTVRTGTPGEIPTITVDDRDALWSIAAMLDRMPVIDGAPASSTPRPVTPRPAGAGPRPGDDFNARADWDAILTPRGWTKGRQLKPGEWTWTRPGKNPRDGISATTGMTAADGHDRLYVFSTSTEFEAETPYTKFAAYALLEHGGNYSAAAKELARHGYGEQRATGGVGVDGLHGLIAPQDRAPLNGSSLPPGPVIPAASPQRLDDAHLSEWMAHVALNDKWCWAGGLGWLRWEGKRWKHSSEAAVTDAVRRAVIDLHTREAKAGADTGRLRQIDVLMSASRIRAVVSLMRGVTVRDADTFDQRPDLLNVANGVIDLRTGQLLPHDPDYLLTKFTRTKYCPGAMHPDWDQTLDALPADVRTWMQVRVGQAATGHPTSDDVLPVLQGGGSNGKSTFLTGCQAALGEHAIHVPERVLTANPSDHPTELMTLFGARFALIEETPEAQHLNVQRLKATVGTPTMTARYIRQDSVTWSTTHSLFLATNYKPRIDETDHGVWRRLVLVCFPRTYPISGLRERIEHGIDGQLEAALAWIVEGARMWYAAGRVMPPQPERVRADTDAWRAESDRVFAYIDEHIEFDPDAAVTATDLLDDFNAFLVERNHRKWSDQTLTERFGGHALVVAHHVEKARPKTPPAGLMPLDPLAPPAARPTVWIGVRWHTSADDVEDAKPQVGQGGQGSSNIPHEKSALALTDDPCPPCPDSTDRAPRGDVCIDCGAPLRFGPSDRCGSCRQRHIEAERVAATDRDDRLRPVRPTGGVS